MAKRIIGLTQVMNIVVQIQKLIKMLCEQQHDPPMRGSSWEIH